MTDFQIEKCREILEHYGFINQRDILIEECAELIQAISKLKRNGERISSNFIEELVDVEIMLEQMKQGLSHDESIEFMTVQREKIERQIARIKGIPERNCTNCVFGCTCSKQKGEQGYCGNYKPRTFNDENCEGDECEKVISQNILDLIKRQQAQIESLEKRFKHLLQSDFIASFDGWDYRKGDYRRDIREADNLIKQIDNFCRDLCNERMLKGKAIADFEDLQDYIRKEKAEAIKEFADRVKESKSKLFNFIYSEREFDNEIDNLEKEMIEKGGVNNAWQID